MVLGVGVVAALVGSMTIAVTPSQGPALTIAPVTINNNQADQPYDPHVDGDLAAYSDAVTGQIHYYRFSTGVDSVIPNVVNGVASLDFLSDVNANRIVFTRSLGTRVGIMLFDVATATITEVDPVNGSNRSYVGLGANTVAFGDQGLDINGEIQATDLVSGTTTRLTSDTIVDQYPAVSPDGNTVVWEKCATINCDVWKATRSGSGWAAAAVTTGADSDTNPDTNGTLVVYDSIRAASATGPDLYYTPVAGGAETQLSIAGEEYNASIRGNYIAFEHRITGQNSDIWLYEISSNRVFAITNTPALNETLNDVTVQADGSVRIVWQASGANGTSILGATITVPAVTPPPPPPPPACSRSQVIAASRSYGPSRWIDGSATFTPALNFAVPASLTTVTGDAGEGAVTLAIAGANALTICRYTAADESHGSSSQPHTYRFAGCRGTGGAVAAGTIVASTGVLLHVDSGKARAGTTTVRLTVGETCSIAGWFTAPHGGHGDDDDDEHDDHHGGGHH
jgi:hypothetical protein